MRPSAFFFDAHARIFVVIAELARRGLPVTLETTYAELRDCEAHLDVGGAEYLTRLVDETPTVAVLAYMIPRLLEAEAKRSYLHFFQRAIQRIHENGIGAAALQHQWRRDLEDLGFFSPIATAQGCAEDSADFLAGDVPEVAWRVERIWPVGSSGFIAGPEKGGKGWLGIELATALTTGTAFLGKFPTTPCRVLWCEEEDSRIRMKRRFLRLLHGQERPHPEAGWLFLSVRRGVNLVTEHGLSLLRGEIESHKPAVVFLVNLREMVPGRDLLKEEDSGLVRDTLRGLVRDFGCDFMILHHFRKAQKGQDKRGTQMLSGSGVWGAWAETWLFVDPQDHDAKTVLATAGCKDAEGVGRFLVTRADTEDGRGVTLVYSDVEGAPARRRARTGGRILISLKEHPGLSVDDLVSQLNLSDKTVRGYLKAMEESGEVLGNQETSKHPRRYWPKPAETQSEMLGSQGKLPTI